MEAVWKTWTVVLILLSGAAFGPRALAAAPSAAEEVPADAPADAIMAPPADIAEAGAWAATAFAGKPAPAARPALDLLFGSARTPFSFIYNKAPSSDLLKGWRHAAQAKDLQDRVEHAARWTDPATGLSVAAVAAAYKRYPAVEWLLTFENQGQKDTPVLEDIQALDVGLAMPADGRAAVLHRIAGDNCTADSFRPLEIPIEPGKAERLAPRGGRSSNGTFPFFNLAFGDQGLFAAVGWSGQWAAAIDRTADGAARLRAGMELTRLILHPGEKIRTPRILLMAWSGDRLAAHNRFRRLLLHHYSPKAGGRPVLLPAFLQCYDRYNRHPTWPSEEGQIHAARVAKDVGTEFLWLDAAWFPGGFPRGVGSWVPSPRFPNGLKPVSDACHRLGLKFMMWFEPERVGKGSQIAAEHPEFVHGGANGGLFKLDDPAARRWLTDLLLKRIEEFGLDWYRNDFNMDPLATWRKNDPEDRQGMTEIRYIEGLYAMWDELIAKRPGLAIDNCASGGRRIDLEIGMRSVPLWQSDINCKKGSEDAHQAQNVCLSLYIPLHTPCAWQADAYELRSVVTAGLVAQFPILEEGFSAEKVRPLVEEVKPYRKFWYGDLYPLTPPSPANDKYMAFELYRPDLREGIVMAFRRSACPDADLPIVLKGLDASKTYRVESVEGLIAPATHRGADLMKAGVTLRLPGPRTSDVIRFRDASLGAPAGVAK